MIPQAVQRFDVDEVAFWEAALKRYISRVKRLQRIDPRREFVNINVAVDVHATPRTLMFINEDVEAYEVMRANLKLATDMLKGCGFEHLFAGAPIIMYPDMDKGSKIFGTGMASSAGSYAVRTSEKGLPADAIIIHGPLMEDDGVIVDNMRWHPSYTIAHEMGHRDHLREQPSERMYQFFTAISKRDAFLARKLITYQKAKIPANHMGLIGVSAKNCDVSSRYGTTNLAEAYAEWFAFHVLARHHDSTGLVSKFKPSTMLKLPWVWERYLEICEIMGWVPGAGVDALKAEVRKLL